MKILKFAFIVVTMLILTYCSSQQTVQIVNLAEAKKLVQNYYESGEFDSKNAKIIDDAIRHIDELKLTNKSVVIFDVDETALSNYDLTKSIDFGYIQKLWHELIQSGKLPAIKETKRFYDYLISRNIHVIFLSGRRLEVRDATNRNLLEQNFNKFDTLIVRKSFEDKIPAAEFKAAKRGELINKGYDIIACIGDQRSDFTGGNVGYKIKLPNYLYLIN